MKRFIVALLALAAAQVAVTAQELPRVEFAIGPGFLSYAIDCSYTDPAGTSAMLGDHSMTDWDNVSDSTTWDIAAEYPAEENIFALNSLFLVRFPLGERFALAYSNRVSFAFDSNVHREDRYGDSDDVVLTLAGITGVELEYYLAGPGKGPWLGGFGGMSVLNQPFVVNYITQLGWGAGATVGWRVSRKMAYELNCFYFSTGIPSFTVEKVEALSDSLSLSGEAAGFAITAGARFGF